MKKKIFTSVLVLLLFAGCNSSEIEKPQDGNDKVINARVENASEFSNVADVKLLANPFSPMEQFNESVEIAYAEWKNGGFIINFPKTVNSSYLYPPIHDGKWKVRLPVATGGFRSDNIYFESLSSVTISNENVKIVNTEIWGVDENARWIAPFSLIRLIDEYNFTKAVFTYVDSDVTIFGSNVVINEFGNPPFEVHNIYSIEWKKGWNVWYLTKSRTVTNDGTPILTRKWSSIPADGLKWHGEEIRYWAL